MKLLIIEDVRRDVEGIVDHFTEKEWIVEVKDFSSVLGFIDEFDPDIIVLDKKEDVSGDESRGESVFSVIWRNGFRPTILFSGLAESFVVDEEFKSLAVEPLFVKIPKGDEKPVIDHLTYLEDIVPSISNFRKKLNIALINSAAAISTIKNATEGVDNDIVEYLFTSRISQYFNEPIIEKSLPVWAQYISPPIGEQLFMGDILVELDENREHSDTSRFAIVLTPSCDLARASESAKVLVAINCSFSSIDDNFGATLGKTSSSYTKRKDRMVSVINQGYKNSKVFLPRAKGVIPDLCFDMKNLEIVEHHSIGFMRNHTDTMKRWIRLLSLSSPYRERISWAYLSTGCRPGVPTLDADRWVDEVFNACN